MNAQYVKQLLDDAEHAVSWARKLVDERSDPSSDLKWAAECLASIRRELELPPRPGFKR